MALRASSAVDAAPITARSFSWFKTRVRFSRKRGLASRIKIFLPVGPASGKRSPGVLCLVGLDFKKNQRRVQLLLWRVKLTSRCEESTYKRNLVRELGGGVAWGYSGSRVSLSVTLTAVRDRHPR